jgi:hypothetical protein
MGDEPKMGSVSAWCAALIIVLLLGLDWQSQEIDAN